MSKRMTKKEIEDVKKMCLCVEKIEGKDVEKIRSVIQGMAGYVIGLSAGVPTLGRVSYEEASESLSRGIIPKVKRPEKGHSSVVNLPLIEAMKINADHHYVGEDDHLVLVFDKKEDLLISFSIWHKVLSNVEVTSVFNNVLMRDSKFVRLLNHGMSMEDMQKIMTGWRVSTISSAIKELQLVANNNVEQDSIQRVRLLAMVADLEEQVASDQVVALKEEEEDFCYSTFQVLGKDFEIRQFIHNGSKYHVGYGMRMKVN